jgi:hypothetical protein
MFVNLIYTHDPKKDLENLVINWKQYLQNHCPSCLVSVVSKYYILKNDRRDENAYSYLEKRSVLRILIEDRSPQTKNYNGKHCYGKRISLFCCLLTEVKLII